MTKYREHSGNQEPPCVREEKKEKKPWKDITETLPIKRSGGRRKGQQQ